MRDDIELHETREEAVEAVLGDCEPGDMLWICRGDGRTCREADSGRCGFCFRTPYHRGMTAADLLARARAN